MSNNVTDNETTEPHTYELILYNRYWIQESCAVARKPRDAAAVLFDLEFAEFKCMLNNCLEWDKWVLNERTYHTPDSCLTHLFPRSQAVVA